MPPFTYSPFVNPYAASIGDLLMRRGDIEANRAVQVANAQAQAAQARGQAWAGAVSDIGNIAGRAITTYAKEQQEAPARARQAEMERLQLDEARSEAERRKAAAVQDRAISSLFAGGRMPTPQELMQAAGPERGTKIAQGIAAFQELATKRVTDARDTAGRLAIGAKSLPPDALARVWPGLRKAAIDGGLGDEASIPAEPATEFLDGVIGWATGKDQAAEAAERALKKSQEERQVRAQEETVRHNKEMERISGLTAGRAEATAAETARHNRVMEGIAQQNADTTRNRYTSSGIDSTMDPAYSTALERAVLGVPAAKRPAVASLANRLWSEGNTKELKDVIRQAAIESENVDTKNQVLGRGATLASLRDTRVILNELKEKGVPTGWLTGTVEDLARRLGKTTNPDYVTLANRLMGTLINYRRSATGAAFSDKESADYQRMFPNYKNDLPVNLALLDGLERELTTYDAEYWNHKLGEHGAKLVGVGQAKPGGSGKIHARDPQGVLHEADAGTALPQGWTLEK